MATPQDYAIGTAAARAVVDADIAQDVPFFFQDEITDAERQTIAAQVAKAVIDAVAAARAKAGTS